MKKYFKIIAIFILVFTSVNWGSLNVQASSQKELVTNEPRNISGAGFWETANIREWLNSDKQNPEYTNVLSSDFSKEKGFLTNFTSDEQDGIAVTKRRFYLSGTDATHYREDSPLTRIPATSGHVYDDLIDVAIFNKNGMKHTEFSSVFSNDKIFIMNEFEIYHYVQMKGVPFAKTDKVGNKGDYWVGANTWNGVGEHTSVIYRDNKINRARNYNSLGIVPAFHLKPSYELKDGRLAKNLNIGDTVNLGEYGGQAMQWEVVNIADGYPLLWSSGIITKKAIQSRGNKFYRFSEHIDFPNADVDITKDLKVYNKSGDITPPQIKIVNRNELSVPKNGSFTLNIQAIDNVGIKRIIMPDGHSVNSDKTSFEVTDNGRYTIKAEDVSGNYSGLTLYVNNINHPSEVELIPNEKGWSNTNVDIQVEANNDVDDFSRASFTQTNFRHVLFPYNTKIGYANKKVRFTGEARLKKANVPVQNYSITAGFTYTSRATLGNGYALQNRYPSTSGTRLFYLKDMDSTFKKFDEVVTIDSEYHDRLNVSITYNYPEIWGKDMFHVEFRNLKTELLDVDDFEITKITLPDGKDIHGKRATYTATKTGKYNFDVLDNRGKVTSKSIDVKIDKVKPELDVIQKDNEWTKHDVILSINASDEGGSGFDRIVLPDGRVIRDQKATFAAEKNGNYEFKAYDGAGNVTTKVHKVNNIDKTYPKLNIDISQKEWTNKNVELTVNASDEGGSKLRDVLIQGENKIKNGDFNNIDKDWLGVTVSSGERQFEKGKVILKDTNESETARTKFAQVDVLSEGLRDNFLVQIKAKGNGKLNARFGVGGTAFDYVDRPQEVSENEKTYEFFVPYDKAYRDQFIIELLGAGEIEITNVNLIETKKLDGNKLDIYENGTYNIIATDNAENMTQEEIVIDNIDKEKPTLSTSQDTNEETHENVTLSIDAKDNLSGIKSITYLGENMIRNGNFSEGDNHWNLQVDQGGFATIVNNVAHLKDKNISANKIGQKDAFKDSTIGAQHFAEIIARGEGIINARYLSDGTGGDRDYKQSLEDKVNFKTYTFPIYRKDNSLGEFMVERIGEDGWAEISEIKVFAQKDITDSKQLEVTQNGSYTFVVEDNAGNFITETHKVTNINKYTKLTKPTIDSFDDISLQSDNQHFSSTINGLTIENWKDNAPWKLQVSATPMSNGKDELPMKLDRILDVNSKVGQSSPSINHNTSKQLSKEKIELISENSNRGKYEIVFDGGLNVDVSSTTRKGEYESKITWELIMAP